MTFKSQFFYMLGKYRFLAQWLIGVEKIEGSKFHLRCKRVTFRPCLTISFVLNDRFTFCIIC